MATAVLTGTQMVKSSFAQYRIQELADGFMVTDSIFMKDTTDALSIVWEENAEGHNPSAEDEVEERGEFGEYPKIGMSTDQKSSMIRDYGLSILLSYNAVTKNQIASINRAYIKLSNSLIKFVDGLGLRTLTDNYNVSSSKINTQAAGVAWSDSSAKPLADFLKAKAKVDGAGYVSDVALVHTDDMTNLLLNDNFRKELDLSLSPEDKIVRSGLIKGKIAGLVLIEAKNLQKGKVWIGQKEMVGTRHQNTKGIETDSYRANNAKKADYIVSAFREFVDVMNEPKAGCLLSGV
ncbi:hypothetical protein ACTFSJ_27800 [Bacillus cereus group sp. MYBK12-2]|uniref:hypothetical protein n=1 Tax=Bacillus cereus group sp. MYBK12-2 TaxID=3450689 RepID=UPI0032F13C3D|nr:major capsid protein [Bacillus pacificus]HDR7653576.1 major capsid protein [Bacillus pacificus]